MKLLLTSFQHPRIPEFVGGRKLVYINDAARSYPNAPFVEKEKQELRNMGMELIELLVSASSPEEVDRILSTADGMYVAGGETFDLLSALHEKSAFEVIQKHVRSGLPYIGTSAGSVIAGNDIEYIRFLDSPDISPDLESTTGLGFTDYAVLPHADGSLPPYPLSVFAKTIAQYGSKYRLILLRDGEALWIEDGLTQLI